MSEITLSAKEYVERLLNTPETLKDPIPSDLAPVVEAMAESSHEGWRTAKTADGYICGSVVDDTAKTHPLLMAYEDLPEDKKDECRRNAVEALNLLLEVGCHIGRPGDFEPATEDELATKVELIVEALHDAWALSKARKGYVYAEQRNDDPAKGQLTHRDMLPFETLMELHPEDAAYDRDTANGAVSAVRAAGFVIGV